jgi:hypothetical protein
VILGTYISTRKIIGLHRPKIKLLARFYGHEWHDKFMNVNGWTRGAARRHPGTPEESRAFPTAVPDPAMTSL